MDGNRQSGSFLLGLATTIPELAPWAFPPFAPILFNIPSSAYGDSVASQLSKEVDCLFIGPVARATTNPTRNCVTPTKRDNRGIVLTICSCTEVKQRVEFKSGDRTEYKGCRGAPLMYLASILQVG